MKKSALLLLIFAVVACQSTGPSSSHHTVADLYTTAHLAHEVAAPAKGIKIAVASGGKHASQAGLVIFQKGGNIVDAAVAVSFCLAVERPHSLGLGGGGLMTLYLTQSQSADVFLDFRESAPLKAKRDMYLDPKGDVIPGLSQVGAKAIGVPGFVKGMQEIHHRWGNLPWKDVVAPAIQLAREGFAIYPTLADRMAAEKGDLARDHYSLSLVSSNGAALKTGETLIQKDLARSLQEIADKGANEFYEGSLAKKIIDLVRKKGGILTLQDLKRYKVVERPPLKTHMFGYDVVTAPPPSAGGPILVEWANVLGGYDRDWLLEDGARYLHILTETMKRGYADRSQFIGDPNFTKEPWARLLSTEYASQLRSSIALDHSTPSAQIRPGSGFKETPGTSHVSILDDLGNAIAITLSINESFGSRLAVPTTGIFLNNTMDDFSAKPGATNAYGLTGSDANAIAPGKRPVSSTMPTIILKNGEAILSIGGAGGSRITSSVAQVIFNFLLVFPGDILKSQSAPRIHHQWLPDRLELETKGFDDLTTASLAHLGHPAVPPPFVARVQAVSRDPKTHILHSVADPRDDGAGAAAQ
ncbi:MAG: gamma-glutamyltransferase [Deltaproteobacteria bacterium]|nr:gamma-glutamyltransferase [Deltaproteobacteria bacterium]